jgi:hypothetical protein
LRQKISVHRAKADLRQPSHEFDTPEQSGALKGLVCSERRAVRDAPRFDGGGARDRDINHAIDLS